MATYEEDFIGVIKDYLTEGVKREKSIGNFNRFLEFENLFTFKDNSMDCVLCRGIDLEKCSSCEQGTVICETCEGSARIICERCFGFVEFLCLQCNHEPCLICGGDGLLFYEYLYFYFLN